MVFTMHIPQRTFFAATVKSVTWLWAIVCLSITATSLAHAQWKPNRTVTLVVPYAAGGGTDTTARATAQQLSEIWGQPVVVENVPGADGLIGTRRVTEAKPDGHTLLLQTPAIVLTKHNSGFKGQDPLTQLVPITNIAHSPGVIVTNPKIPANSLPELIRYCKTAATPCSLGTGENVAKLLGQKLLAEEIHNLIIVNYKGTSAIIADLLANNVNFAITGVTSAIAHHKAGSLKIIASQGQRRSLGAPEVPSVFETGVPQYEFTTWFGLFAPQGTPSEVAQSVYLAVQQAMRNAALQKSIEAAGAEPLVNTPIEFIAQIQKENERFSHLVKNYPLH